MPNGESRLVAVDTYTSLRYPHLSHVRLETDDGTAGIGETFHRAEAVETYIHHSLSRLILGLKGTNVAEIRRRVNSRYDGGNVWTGTATIDSGAASAIDIAAWDLRARLLGVSLIDALGGPIRDRIRVYSTCSGYMPLPKSDHQMVDARENPEFRYYGIGGPTEGPYEDYEAQWTRPAELARELIAEGYTAMKLFTFRPPSRESLGLYISPKQLDTAVAPLRAIREEVGNEIELMVDLLFGWSLAPCQRIVAALEEFDLLWIEDPLWWGARRYHKTLQEMTRTPISAFDYAAGTEAYLRMLDDGGLSIFRIDIQWCGGISEAVRIASLAHAVGIPVAFHNVTGPVQFVANTHLGLHVPNAVMQESARANWRSVYPEIVTECSRFVDGHAVPPSGNGLGTEFTDEYLSRSDVRQVRTELRGGAVETRVVKERGL